MTSAAELGVQAGVDWTIVTFAAEKLGRLVTLNARLTYSGSAITADSAGNLSDRGVLDGLPPGWRPADSAVFSWSRGAGVHAGTGAVSAGGKVSVQTFAPGAQLSPGHVIVLTATYPAADPPPAISAFTPQGGDASRLGRPAGRDSGPLLVYCHGVSGNEQEFSLPAYDDLRAWMNSNGWAWLEVNAGGPGWGNDTQCTAYRAAYDHALTMWQPTSVVIFGRSMGGVVASWLYLCDPVLSQADGLILCSAVQDIDAMRGIYGASIDAALPDGESGRSPLRWDRELYDGRRVLWQNALDDTIVPPAAHGFAQRDRVASRLATSVVDTATGDHASTRSRSRAQIAFLAMQQS